MKKVLALTLALLIVLPLVSCRKKKKPQDNPTPPTTVEKIEPLFNLDLSEYISIDEKYYKNFDVTVKVNTVTEEEVEQTIHQMLVNNRVLIENEDVVVEEGHVVSIFYTGYYLEGGEKVYFNGGSNVGGKPYPLEIGSGAFIPGFEEGLIGKKPKDYGVETPLTVEARFPDDYGDSTLAGKTAYFEVSFEFINKKYYGVYEIPELTENYIKGTLKFTDAFLANYDGTNTVERYRSYIRHAIKWYGVDLDTCVLRELEKLVMDGAVIKKYPEKQLQDLYEKKIKKLEDRYEAEYSGIKDVYSFEKFACSQLGVPDNSDWKAAALEETKYEMKIELIIYRIMELENLKPSKEEYARLLDEYITSYLANVQGITSDNFKNEEEFNSYKEQRKAWFAASYGEHYLQSIIYRSIWTEAVIEFANIIEITE